MANSPKGSEQTTAVHWPAQAEAKRPPSAKTQAAHRKHKFAARSEKRKERIARADKNERRAEHAHRHKRTHTSADGPHKKRAAQRKITNIYGLLKLKGTTPPSGRGGAGSKTATPPHL